MQHKVLLVRTRETIGTVADFLANRGISVIQAPVMWVKPILRSPSQISNLLTRSHIICCLSQNAISTLHQYQGHLTNNAAIWAVGNATHHSASQLFGNVKVPERQTSEGLLDAIKSEITPGVRVTLLKGVGGREYLTRQLSQMGAIISQLNLYQRNKSQDVLAQLPELLGCQQFSAIMVGSGELLNALSDNSPESIVQIPIIVPSNRVAEMAREKGFWRVHIADGVSKEALVETYRDICF